MTGARVNHARGFTLLELLVSVLITAGIAGATVAALSQSLRASDTSRQRQEVMMQADTVAARIARDIAGVVREGDLFYARVLITDRRADRHDRDEILLFTTMNRRLRAGWLQNEGGEYEVQYRLIDDPDAQGDAAHAGVLWRRVDPVPDDVPDGGGVAIPVAGNITDLSIEAFDGESWQPAWDSDRDGYPHAVRVSVRALSPDASRSETARRVIAIDRVPAPVAAPVTSDDDRGGGA